MTTALGGLWTILGLAALAAILFALQRLRVRQRTLTVETTLFWRQATEEARARVFVERFRHPWVYVLLLAIASLLWLSFAELRIDASSRFRSLVLIDGSARAASGERFAEKLVAVEGFVTGLPRDSRRVVWCGGRTRTLLAPGEHSRLLRERLEGRQPEICPSSVERVIRSELERVAERELRIYVAGSLDVEAAWLAALPKGVRVTQLTLDAGVKRANQGITALGFGAATSGEWGEVDVLVEVSAAAATASAPTVTIDGQAPGQTLEALPGADSPHARFVLRDVEARGQELAVRVAGQDALVLDDVATLFLPKREPLRVALASGVPALLAQVVEADPGLVRDDARPQVEIRMGGGAATSARAPGLSLVSDSEQEDAFLLECRRDEDPRRTLDRFYARLGLDEIDAMELARQSGKRITLGVLPADRRAVRVWQGLFSPAFNFVHSRSFALFVSMSLRWVAERWEAPATMPVGEHVHLPGRELRDPRGRVVRTLGDVLLPTEVGAYEAEDGSRVAASLLDRATTVGTPGAAEVDRADAAGGGFDTVSVLLVLALLLLVAEWVLYRRGRLP